MRIQVDTREWQKAVNDLGRANATKVAVRALNRTIKSAMSEGVKLAAADLKLPQKKVRERLTVTMAKASGSAPFASLYGSTKRFGVINWAKGSNPSRGKGNVRSKMPGGQSSIPGAFVATVGSHTAVFKRQGESKRKSQGAWSPNLPIVELRGASAAEVMTKHIDVMAAKAVTVLAKNFAHEYSYLLSKLSK